MLTAIPAEDVEMVALVPPGILDVDMAGHPLLLYLVITAEGGVGGDVSLMVSSVGRYGGRSAITADVRSGSPERRLSANVAKSDTREIDLEGVLLPPPFGASVMRRTGGLETSRKDRRLSVTAQWQKPAGNLVQGRFNLFLNRNWQLPVPAERPDAVDMSGIIEARGGDVAIDWRRPLDGASGELALTGLHSQKESRLQTAIMDAGLDSVTWQDSRSGETALRGLSASSRFNFMEGGMRYLVQGQEIPVPGGTSHVEESRGGVFAQVAWLPSDRVTLEGSLRWEYSSLCNRTDRVHDTRFCDWLPRLSLDWSLQPGSKITAGLERKVGQLAFSQFLASVNLSEQAVTAGAPALEPERSWVGEIVYERRFDETGLLQLRVSHERIDNPFDVVVLDEVAQVPANVQPAVVDTISLQLNLPLEQFGVTGGILTLSRKEVSSRMTDPVTGSRREVGMRPFSGSLMFRQDLPGGLWAWGITIADSGRGTMFGATSIVDTKTDAQLGVFGEWRVVPSARLVVGSRNRVKTGHGPTTIWRRGARARSLIWPISSRSGGFRCGGLRWNGARGRNCVSKPA